MDLSRYKVEVLEAAHIKDVTSLWRESMTKALGIAPVHPFASQAYFLEHILPVTYQVYVVVSINDSQPVAFMASSDNEVSQLYVAPRCQGQGIGSYLLNMAKDQSGGSLVLRTFEINQVARRFYSAHGFTAQVGSCDNEEGLPDLVCQWTA